MGKTFKSIQLLIEEEDSFISAIPNNLGINLCSVKGIEYERMNDEQLQSLKIIFIPEIKYSLPSVYDAGVIAAKISENIEAKLTDQEQAFFIAGFQECIKYLKTNVDQK